MHPAAAPQVLWWKHIDSEYAAEVAAQADVFGGEDGAKRQADFKLRVIEHNLQVIAGYYSRITLPRLAQMLDLTADEVRPLGRLVPLCAPGF